MDKVEKARVLFKQLEQKSAEAAQTAKRAFCIQERLANTQQKR